MSMRHTSLFLIAISFLTYSVAQAETLEGVSNKVKTDSDVKKATENKTARPTPPQPKSPNAGTSRKHR
jgi:hypothetical protein